MIKDYEKIKKLLDLAGEDPQTIEQKTAYKKACELIHKAEAETPSFGGYIGDFMPQTDKALKLFLKETVAKIKGLKDQKITIPWDRFFKKLDQPYSIYLLKPGRSTRNNKAADLANVISSFYLPVKDLVKFKNEGAVITKRSPYRCNFRIVMKANEIGFYLIIPNEKTNEILRRLEGSYGTSITIEKVNDIPHIDPEKAFCTELHYRKHDIFSLDTDKTNNFPLPSLLTAVRTLQGEDVAVFDALFQPYNRKVWYREALKAFKLLDKGQMPYKGAGGTIATALNEAMTSLRYELAEFTAVTKEQKMKVKQKFREELRTSEAKFIKDGLSKSTTRKAGEEVLNTYLRIAVQSDSKERRQAAAYNIANSFVDIKLDNELVRQDIGDKHTVRYVKAIENREPGLMSRGNKLSTDEAGKFVQLPGDSLLKEFPEVLSQTIAEVRLPDELSQDDIPHVRIAFVTERGKKILVCQPLVAYGNIKLKHVYDALCTATFAQGKQGSGKSEGYGSTWAYDMVTQGFTVIIIDTADGQVLRNFINALPLDFPEDHIHALGLDNKAYPIPLGWDDIYGRKFNTGDGEELDEELQALEISVRITNKFLSFINSLSNTGDFTDRMQQYVISCMRAITTQAVWSFLDLELCLTSPAYRQELLNTPAVQAMPEVMRDLWNLQERTAAGKEGEIINPILTRIKILANSQFMANLFYQEPKRHEDGRPVLDLRAIMDNNEGGKYGHVVAIHASSDAWQDNQATILGFFLDKINFNAFSRIDQSQDERKPVLVWIDEPHKVIANMEKKLAGTAVEFRKYRIKNLFTGHSIEQMGAAANSLLDGGAQITSYKTENLKELQRYAHMFKPYSDAEELYDALPEKWKAINVVRLPSGESCPAFIGDMIMPYDPKKPVKDRTYIWNECAKKYGRPWKEVKNHIQEKRLKYQQLDRTWLQDLDEAMKKEKAEAAEAKKREKAEALETKKSKKVV